MLYITTRNTNDARTASWPLNHDRSPDGGLYVPYHLPVFEKEQIASLAQQSFGQTMAQMLNLFFSCGLTGFDVDLCIGRSPVKLSAMSRRLLVAELWHNPRSTYSYVQACLFDRILDQKPQHSKCTDWAKVAIRISMLFAVYGQLLQDGMVNAEEKLDISVNSGDFSAPMAAWYARKMGLPLGMIICTCGENGSLWDLIRRGEFNTGAVAKKTGKPELDITRPDSLERLICETLDAQAVERYLTACEKGRIFALEEEESLRLSEGLFASVVGEGRVDAVMQSVEKTNAYTMDFMTAMSYGGLQDYRASTGESCLTLLLSEACPG